MRDYLALIAPQHRAARRFTQHMALIVAATGNVTGTARELNRLFSLDAAAGGQLDCLGEWIGLSRFVKTPIVGVYFALDDARVGFNLGSWKRAYDADSGFTELDDETYRTILRAKILANHWDGTCDMLATVYQQVIPDGSVRIFVDDNQDMSMDVYLTGGTIAGVTRAVIRQGYLNIKPAGVGMQSYINSAATEAIFGFDASNHYVSGFDTGGWSVKL